MLYPVTIRSSTIVAIFLSTLLLLGCGRTSSLSETQEEADQITSGVQSSATSVGDEGVINVHDVGSFGNMDAPPVIPEETIGPRVLRIAVGAKHTCALDEGGDVFCWGKNTSYQIGVEGPDKVLIPTKVPGVENAVWLEANAHHTCAAVRDGSLWCWGQPGPGQAKQLPKRVQGVKPVRRVWIAADGGVCAKFSDGSNCLSTAKGGDDSVHWFAGRKHECLAFKDGHVECRGDNTKGQLGNGTLVGSDRRFQKVAGLPTIRVTKKGTARIGAGRSHSCAAGRKGNVYCWGGNKYGQLGKTTEQVCGGRKGSVCETKPIQVPGIDDALDVVSRYDHSCARRASGKLTCWGHARYGVLGPKDKDSNTVAGLAAVSQVGLGRTHTCVLMRDGNVRCWGMNTDGQCGAGEKTRVKTPSSIAWKAAKPPIKPEGTGPQKESGQKKSTPPGKG
jgi:alpha-tubulin suppressor-like RCC1 family protein